MSLRAELPSEEHIGVELLDVDNCIFPFYKKELANLVKRREILSKERKTHENFFAFLEPFEYKEKTLYPVPENKAVYEEFSLNFMLLRKQLLAHHKKMLDRMIKRIKKKILIKLF